MADFIGEALAADGTVMANSAYRAVYEAYMGLYDAGHPQEEILRKLLDSEDRLVADTSAKLSTEKYQLTVSAFEASLTTTSSWLVSSVPKAILVYNERRIQDNMDTLRRDMLTADSDGQLAIMQKLLKLQAAQRRIKQLTGREKKLK